jgi:hypothetical protein
VVDIEIRFIFLKFIRNKLPPLWSSGSALVRVNEELLERKVAAPV